MSVEAREIAASLPSAAFLATEPFAAAGPTRTNILVVGGGPAGLAFAAALHELAGERVSITLSDGRWARDGEGVRWRDKSEGVNRRRQVVTIQSSVFRRLPPAVTSAMFPPRGYQEVWPLGRESPARLGYPRNVRICDLEDRLLALVRAQGLKTRAETVDPARLPLGPWDLIVIADGARSRTREHFAYAFGRADETSYSFYGQPLVDVALGVPVRVARSDSAAVLLTVAQQRFLYNGLDGAGFLYMRLTDAEAAEARDGLAHLRLDAGALVAVRQPLSPFARLRGWTARGVPASRLRERLQEGLKLFDARPLDGEAPILFNLGMTRRGAFSAELTPPGSPRRTFGALIGDAAGAMHFWPGRGLNRGLSSAYALAVTVSRFRLREGLRCCDLMEFEGVMAQLQSRHQDRAWRSMVQLCEGRAAPVKAVIERALAGRRFDRQDLLRAMQQRLAEIASRLSGRLPNALDLGEACAAVESVDAETLAVLVGAGPWETVASGGREVDVDASLGLNPP